MLCMGCVPREAPLPLALPEPPRDFDESPESRLAVPFQCLGGPVVPFSLFLVLGYLVKQPTQNFVIVG